MFYVDRMDHGMIRDLYFEKKMFSWASTQRVVHEDALKMRTWRSQRELEMNARRGEIDGVIANSLWEHTLNPEYRRRTQNALPERGEGGSGEEEEMDNRNSNNNKNDNAESRLVPPPKNPPIF